MKYSLIRLLSLICLFTQVACSQGNNTDKNSKMKNHVEEGTYWNEGMAEVAIYDLQQNRYKDLNEGQLVSIFVTEDFLYDKQVKNDHYKEKKSTPILKNIQNRKFPTGVYDYSLFSSAFTPLDRNKFPKTLKVSGSSQEWCGTTYTQLNYRNKSYVSTLHSYFESEADRKDNFTDGYTEDGLFNVLRMNPDMLPTGDIDFIPSVNVLRLKHLESKTYQSTATLQSYTGSDFKGDNLKVYHISTPALKRDVKIVFESESPFQIVGWTDRYPSVFDQQLRTTKATLTKVDRLAYWKLNSLGDESLRKEFGLK